MATRRVVIGKYNDGVNFGLRCSLPGIDALTGDSNGGGFSFDSNWSDIVNVLQVGVVAGGSSSTGTQVLFPNPGYKPFVEFRQLSGGVTVSDDFTNEYVFTGALASNNPHYGYGVNVVLGGINCTGLFAPDQAIYVVYKIPTATG